MAFRWISASRAFRFSWHRSIFCAGILRSFSSISSETCMSTPSQISLLHQSKLYCNVTPGVEAKVGRNLHLQPRHPIGIIKRKIQKYFDQEFGVGTFRFFDNLHPRISTQQCFDDLLIEQDHPSRSPTDTYYYDRNTVLRTHTSAHETQFLADGIREFLITGDCYRRDEIDATHYPVFHQMEGVRIIPGASIDQCLENLKKTLAGLARNLFGNVEMRFLDDNFPWTDPSIQLEVMYNGKWLELLGAGVIRRKFLDLRNVKENGWAFGLGLERWAMILFDIPDIRLFWSEDPRFIEQFKEDTITKFEPFSKYPAVSKDVTFWLPSVPFSEATEAISDIKTEVTKTGFHENDFCAFVREIAGDLVEKVECIDTFQHPKTRRISKCYRIHYRSHSKTLNNNEVDAIQFKLRKDITEQLALEIR